LRKIEMFADLVNRMREGGYASGTINRVIVILRYLYNLARKWEVTGVVDNPAAGLSAGPDVQRNRFLSEEEAEALVHSINADQNQTAARAIMLLLLPVLAATKSASPGGTTSTGRTRHYSCRNPSQAARA
jgi:site-specific recombinase XerD